MDRLTDYLEELIEESGTAGESFDVEYSVSRRSRGLGVIARQLTVARGVFLRKERRLDFEPGRERDVRRQQAAAEQADLALEPAQVSHAGSLPSSWRMLILVLDTPGDSGPKRYDYDSTHRVWFYHRDGTLLRNLLNEELRVLMSNEAVDIDLGEEDQL